MSSNTKNKISPGNLFRLFYHQILAIMAAVYYRSMRYEMLLADWHEGKQPLRI